MSTDIVQRIEANLLTLNTEFLKIGSYVSEKLLFFLEKKIIAVSKYLLLSILPV